MSIIRPFLCLLGLFAATAIQAQGTYPNRPIRIIVAVTPGGTSDLIARGIAKEMSDDLGQSVVVENRPSASSLVGTQLAARAAPDGYTLLHMANTFAVVPSLLADPGYELKDFVGISLTGIVPKILSVSPSVPVHSVEELIALARSKPGQVTYASAGLGGTGHMSAELFSNQLGLKMVHVPYKGASQALTDLIGGQVMMMFDEMTSSMTHVRSGRIRPLAVTSKARTARSASVAAPPARSARRTRSGSRGVATIAMVQWLNHFLVALKSGAYRPSRRSVRAKTRRPVRAARASVAALTSSSVRAPSTRSARRSSGLLVARGDLGEACEIGELQRMKRRARCEGQRCVAATLDEQARAQRDAALPLAPAGPESRVPLQRLDVVVTARDGVLQLVEGDVLASTDEHLGHERAILSVSRPCIRSARRRSRRR